MMQNIAVQGAGRPYVVFNPLFEGYSNERLYDALCAATAPLDAGLEELQHRLRPIILNAAKAFLNALSWTFDNAMGEALIFIWDLVRKHSYKEGRIPFDRFFGKVWKNRLNDLFAKTVMKNPVQVGNFRTGWYKDQPVYVSEWGFHPMASVYRARKSARQAAWYDKKLAREGKTRQQKKPPMTEEEKREKARLRARARFASMTPEERAEMYAKNNARRKAMRDAETPEEKEARNAKVRAWAKARRAKAN